MAVKKLTTFHRFGELPRELRNTVWNFASYHPRDVDVLVSRNSDGLGKTSLHEVKDHEDLDIIFYGKIFFKSLTPTPSVLLTSHESREEALRVYTMGFHPSLYGAACPPLYHQAHLAFSLFPGEPGFLMNPCVERYHFRFDPSALVVDQGMGAVEFLPKDSDGSVKAAVLTFTARFKDTNHMLLSCVYGMVGRWQARHISVDITELGDKAKVLVSAQYLMSGALLSAWMPEKGPEVVELRVSYKNQESVRSGRVIQRKLERIFKNSRATASRTEEHVWKVSHIRRDVEEAMRTVLKVWTDWEEDDSRRRWRQSDNLIEVRRPYPVVRLGETGSDMVDEKPKPVQSWRNLAQSALKAVVLRQR